MRYSAWFSTSIPLPRAFSSVRRGLHGGVDSRVVVLEGILCYVRRCKYALYSPALHGFYEVGRYSNIRRAVVNSGHYVAVHVGGEAERYRLFGLLLEKNQTL